MDLAIYFGIAGAIMLIGLGLPVVMRFSGAPPFRSRDDAIEWFCGVFLVALFWVCAIVILIALLIMWGLFSGYAYLTGAEK